MIKISSLLTKEEIEALKYICSLFNAQYIWINTIKFNAPPKISVDFSNNKEIIKSKLSS